MKAPAFDCRAKDVPQARARRAQPGDLVQIQQADVNRRAGLALRQPRQLRSREKFTHDFVEFRGLAHHGDVPGPIQHNQL